MGTVLGLGRERDERLLHIPLAALLSACPPSFASNCSRCSRHEHSRQHHRWPGLVWIESARRVSCLWHTGLAASLHRSFSEFGALPCWVRTRWMAPLAQGNVTKRSAPIEIGLANGICTRTSAGHGARCCSYIMANM